MEYKLIQGVWGEKLDTTWEFFIADEIPRDMPVSAVMGLPFWDGKMVLVQTKRGWEIPGGHIEEGEDVVACLSRELLEEVGAHSISSMKLFGYRKIVNPDRKIIPNNGKRYPRKTIVPYYLVGLSDAPTGAQAPDCLASDVFESTDALVMGSHDYSLITIALTAKMFLDKRF